MTSTLLWTKTVGLALLLPLGLGPIAAQEPELPVETVRAWEGYVRLTEARIEDELSGHSGPGGGFRVLDFADPERARQERLKLLDGETVMERLETRGPNGDGIEVHGGMIHHWRGAVLIPGATLEEVLENVQNPEAAEGQQEDVLETRVLDRGEGWLRLYLKLVRSKIVTATYNTEHLVEYRRHGPTRASSRTVATRIAELADAGTPEEREKAPGEDRGFLWRMNSYWRYEQVEAGVIVECESLTLSRSIPFLAKPFVSPIVTRVARESLGRTLDSLRERMRNDGADQGE
jgi:hypothetical protein